MRFVSPLSAVSSRLLTVVCIQLLQAAIRLFAVLFVLFGMALPATGTTEDNAATPQSCLIPDAGAPSCGVESSPGSSPYDPDVPHKVGNPIDVVSGNKYQYELDYRSVASGLALARHYNSTLSHYNVGIGSGWRHSYQVVLTRISDERLDIVQSDGRLISFYRDSTDQADIYVASLASDGYLRLGDRSTWYLADGRRMIFQGSYLVRMELGERAGSLNLHYQAGRLHSVTDRHGERLIFHYVPGSPTLPQYGSGKIVQPAGSIASVTLPSGDVLEYNYGEHDNLVGIQYPDEDSVGYVYGNSDWPSHLTRRQSTVDGRLSEWRYDEQGLGVAWIESGGINGLQIERGEASQDAVEALRRDGQAAGTKEATVTYADGRKTQYRWSLADEYSHDGVAASGITCDNCMPTASSESSFADSVDEDSGSVSDSGTDAQGELELSDDLMLPNMAMMSESVQSLLAGLSLAENQPDSGTGRTDYSGIYPHPQGDVPLQLTIDRLGKVRDLTIGETTLRSLLEATLSGKLQACFSGDFPENRETFSHDRIAALGRGEPPCALDPYVIVEFKYSVETALSPAGDYRRLKSSGDAGYKRDVPFWHDMRRYCGLPPGKTCEELEGDLAMATMSQCSYGRVSCEPEFRSVSPEEVGIPFERFHVDGFDAELYYDDGRDIYVLAFRGTDGEGDDWENNFSQADGSLARQYQLAVRLGTDVVRALPGENVEFTGHSLGGGLASVAAIQTQSQATVFNTAALQPRVATLIARENEYQEADYYINHVHTRLDMVTIVQQLADDLDFNDMQTAPGRSTEIPNPDIPWMNAAHESADSIISGSIPVLWHSIAGVVHVLESLIEMNCRT